MGTCWASDELFHEKTWSSWITLASMCACLNVFGIETLDGILYESRKPKGTWSFLLYPRHTKYKGGI